MSIRTEEAYVGWVRRFSCFIISVTHRYRGGRDPGLSDPPSRAGEGGGFDAEWRPQRLGVSVPSPAETAVSGDRGDRTGKRPRRLPTVFTAEEATAVLA